MPRSQFGAEVGEGAHGEVRSAEQHVVVGGRVLQGVPQSRHRGGDHAEPAPPHLVASAGLADRGSVRPERVVEGGGVDLRVHVHDRSRASVEQEVELARELLRVLVGQTRYVSCMR